MQWSTRELLEIHESQRREMYSASQHFSQISWKYLTFNIDPLIWNSINIQSIDEENGPIGCHRCTISMPKPHQHHYESMTVLECHVIAAIVHAVLRFINGKSTENPSDASQHSSAVFESSFVFHTVRFLAFGIRLEFWGSTKYAKQSIWR